MSRAIARSYTPPGQAMAFGLPPTPEPPEDPNHVLVTLPVVARFRSANQKDASIVVAEIEDGAGGLPRIRAMLESKGLAKNYSIRLDGHDAERIARKVLAGDEVTIKDFRTLNALAAIVLWFMRGGIEPERFEVLRVEIEETPEARLKAKAEANRQRQMAETAREIGEQLL